MKRRRFSRKATRFCRRCQKDVDSKSFSRTKSGTKRSVCDPCLAIKDPNKDRNKVDTEYTKMRQRVFNPKPSERYKRLTKGADSDSLHVYKVLKP